MGSPTLPVFQEADGSSDQLNLQIDHDTAFHTTLSWLRIDKQGHCIETEVIPVEAHVSIVCSTRTVSASG